MVKATNISYTYGEMPLFKGGNFSVGKNMKVGIVGPNGAGKSTLLGLIAGELLPDSGSIVREGTVITVAQEIGNDFELDHALSVRLYVDSQNKMHDHLLNKIFSGMELENIALSDSPKNLSGGQKTRLALIRALILEPDILLLDEPTNFLDIEGTRWIMNFLKQYPKTLVLISHDIDLIDENVDKIIAINPKAQTIEEFKGSYSEYQRVSRQKDSLLIRNIVNEQKHLKRMKLGLIKMDRFTSDKGVRQRTQLKKRIQRLEEGLPQMPREARSIRFTFPTHIRLNEVPILVENISKSFDEINIITDLSFEVKRGEKVALIGPNGAGKTTLIKMLLGVLNIDSGRIMKDDKLEIGYYSQEFEEFDVEKSPIELLTEYSKLGENILRPLLAGFLFSGNMVHQKIKTLSGGEKTRLSIARLLCRPHNMLILDEPTTYLDAMSQRIILESLKQYSGTILIVSHTPEFIRELSPDKVIIMPFGLVKTWSDELIDEVSQT